MAWTGCWTCPSDAGRCTEDTAASDLEMSTDGHIDGDDGSEDARSDVIDVNEMSEMEDEDGMALELILNSSFIDLKSLTQLVEADIGGKQSPEDITKADVERGMDKQGLQLSGFSSRENWRSSFRVEDGRSESDLNRREFYSFNYSTSRLQCSFGHTQLRNLVVATSKHDVYAMCSNRIYHWNAMTKVKTEVLNFVDTGFSVRGNRPMRVTTIAAMDDIVASGGLQGELTVKNVSRNEVLFEDHVSLCEDRITNAIDLHHGCDGKFNLMTSNNDKLVRLFDMNNFTVYQKISFTFAVNHSTRQPGGKMLCVGGDEEYVALVDITTGALYSMLNDHTGYAFATGWHPDGRLVATGNQDNLCKVWDVRNPFKPLISLPGWFGAIRSVKFTNDGKFLVMSDEFDYVYIYDVAGGVFLRYQEIEMIGYISGISLSPDDDSLFIGLAGKEIDDRDGGFLLEYERKDWRKGALSRHSASMDLRWLKQKRDRSSSQQLVPQ